MLRYHDRVTPLNWTMTARLSWAMSTTKQSWFYHFFDRDLINDNSSFYSHFLSAIDLHCHVFPFEKLLLNVIVCKWHFWWRHIWHHLHVTILKFWDKFSNGLIYWSIKMICAKNYKTATKFVKVMPRILWPLFFPGHGVEVETCESAICIWIGISNQIGHYGLNLNQITNDGQWSRNGRLKKFRIGPSLSNRIRMADLNLNRMSKLAKKQAYILSIVKRHIRMRSSHRLKISSEATL